MTKPKNGSLWLKVLSAIMALNLFVLGYIVTEVRETRKIAHEVDKRTALVELKIEMMDGKLEIEDAFWIAELLKKTDGR